MRANLMTEVVAPITILILGLVYLYFIHKKNNKK